MLSLWADSAERPHFSPLGGDAKTDVLIIGGGMAGLLCARALQDAGVDYMLVEADRICGGITENTTAKITSQHGLIYNRLIHEFGTEKARLYLEANEAALEKYRRLCKNIDCDFEEKPAYAYSEDSLPKIEKELSALEKLGFSAGFASELPLPFPVAGAVKFEHQAQFHPLKFAFATAKDLRIFEHTKVLELSSKGALTNRGFIRAEKIIVATHFPFINKHGAYFLKLYQSRSYVLALENAAELGGMYIDGLGKGLSFRNSGGFLLLGGGSHRTGKKGGCRAELEAFAGKFYPDSEGKYRWATQDCMTLDGVPYIGQYSASTPNLFVTTGFNKWGMTSAMAGADILCDLVRGKENPYAAVFSPSRSILRPQLAINAAEAVFSLITPTVPRCPHMGCALKYNPAEHSWDCPCHGSRFSEGGELLDNPATDGIKLKVDS